jgi:hypothetical protein
LLLQLAMLALLLLQPLSLSFQFCHVRRAISVTHRWRGGRR